MVTTRRLEDQPVRRIDRGYRAITDTPDRQTPEESPGKPRLLIDDFQGRVEDPGVGYHHSPVDSFLLRSRIDACDDLPAMIGRRKYGRDIAKQRPADRQIIRRQMREPQR